MGIKLINIGFGNIVSANRLVAIVSPESAPIKRIIQEARDRGMLIDATYGRRTRAVIITDSDHVILSAVQPETVAHRLVAKDETVDEEITRLGSHISQIRKTLSLSEPIGRKLDFIIQEMNRETNTIGSKSSDIKMTNIVIDIKNILEKIREQVQNIE